MKRIYINEESISNIARKDVLPKFLYKMVKLHMTSLGDNAAFPSGGDFPFDYTVLKKRYKEVLEDIGSIGLADASEDELLNELGRLVKRCKELEAPIKNALEMICENTANKLLATPKGSVNLECKIVGKVEFKNSPRMTPEMDTESSYSFIDIADFESSSAAIGKRRLVDALVQGAAYTYANGDGFIEAYEDDINKINQDLMPLYRRITVINNYLLFTKKEEMSDERPMQGSYVSVSLGSDGRKTTIKSQGVIFPLLLQETIKGFFELFASHGLPRDPNKAKYIIRKADFMIAEPWDMRLGVGLWEKIFGSVEYASVIPYMFVRLVTMPTEEFNAACKEMFASTKKGKSLIRLLYNDATRDSDYQDFTDRIAMKNADKALIADSYFTASELSALDLDDEDGEEGLINDEDEFTMSDGDQISEDGSYDEFTKNQGFRYEVIANLAEKGYLFHGTDGDAWDSVDTTKIKGGTRAVYGYGVYFTNEAYKCEEYGNNFIILDGNNFNFLNLDAEVGKRGNPFSAFQMAKDRYASQVSQLNRMLSNCSSNAEYDSILQEIDELQEKLGKFDEEPRSTIYHLANRMIYNSERITYKNLNAQLREYNVEDEEISKVYLEQHYDGFKCGNQFVVFNFDKLNKNIVRDKDALISSAQITEGKDFLLEAASIEDIYNKYYSKIPQEDFNQIIQADPTYNPQKPNKMGKYGKWLLGLYTQGNLKVEDLYKATDDLRVFSRFQNRLEQKDIMKYHSLGELYSAIEPYAKDPTQAVTKSDVVRKVKEGAEHVYEDEKWLVIVPHTKEASCYYGKGTRWCTAADNSYNMFDYYNKQGFLYININKETNEKYQFHFESSSFMDASDEPIKEPISEAIGMTKGLADFYASKYGIFNTARLWFSIIGVYDNYVIVTDSHDKENFLMQDGKILSQQWFDSVNYFDEGFARVKLDDKRNFLTQDGKVLSKQWFDEVHGFNDCFAIVGLDGKYNFLTQDGKVLSKQWFDSVDYFDEGFTRVELDGKWNFLTQDGKILSQQWFDGTSRLFFGNFAKVELNGKYNFLMQDGKVFSKQWFDKAHNFIGNFAMVELNGKYNFLTQDGKILSQQWFDWARDFIDGFARVELDGKWNFLTRDGKILSQQWFDRAYDFENGFVIINLHGKWNFLTQDGNILSQQWFDMAYDFNGDFAIVKLGDDYYNLSKDGKLYDI